jgi:hypothetical protein
MQLSVCSLLAIILASLISCVGRHKITSGEEQKLPSDVKLKAWNEDTVSSIQFGMAKRNNFYYSIIKSDAYEQSLNNYRGKWTKSSDTIFLIYHKSMKPKTFKSFLILDMTGNYLIQSQGLGLDRIFLRIQNRPIEARGYWPPMPWDSN